MLLLLGKCCKEWKKRSFRHKPNALDTFIKESISSGLQVGEKEIIKGPHEIELGVMTKNPMKNMREAKKK